MRGVDAKVMEARIQGSKPGLEPPAQGSENGMEIIAGLNHKLTCLIGCIRREDLNPGTDGERCGDLVVMGNDCSAPRQCVGGGLNMSGRHESTSFERGVGRSVLENREYVRVRISLVVVEHVIGAELTGLLHGIDDLWRALGIGL